MLERLSLLSLLQFCEALVWGVDLIQTPVLFRLSSKRFDRIFYCFPKNQGFWSLSVRCFENGSTPWALNHRGYSLSLNKGVRLERNTKFAPEMPLTQARAIFASLATNANSTFPYPAQFCNYQRILNRISVKAGHLKWIKKMERLIKDNPERTGKDR